VFVARRDRSKVCPSTFRLRSDPAVGVGLKSSTLEVRTTELGNRAYFVAPEGTLDVTTTARLEDALAQLVEARASLVIVDLNETSLADSAPLGLLVIVQAQLSRRGGGLVLACADRTALELLEATGLNAVFLIERSLPPLRRESRVRRPTSHGGPRVGWRQVTTKRR
jgi:anti-anti-sigma factor